MDTLKAFLGSLTVAEREAFAAQCGTTRGVLQNVMYGLRSCAEKLAVAIERESKGAVRRWDLRPDDWHLIWPELVGTAGAPRLSRVAANDIPSRKKVAHG